MTQGRPRALLKRGALVVGLAAVVWISVPTLLIGAMIAQSSWVDWRRCRGHTRFDAREWRDPALVRGTTEVRECMVDDLLARHPLVDRPRSEVVALLGEPAPTNYLREYDLVYWLGAERSLAAIDSLWLVVELDAAGRVAVARLVTD